jgi:predicted AAA+ superfamily ATPase
MIRLAADALDQWLQHPHRKPIVLRGARQVGKTWLVRDLAKRHNLRLVELNFERLPEMADLFSSNNPSEILKNIEAQLSTRVVPTEALLFLDEIQAVPELFSKLRWFKEDMPSLPVIAAGSLLELEMGTYAYSMPVGRVTYLCLEPLSFFEFVLASGNTALYERLASFDLNTEFPLALHEKCLNLYRDYCLVGGMPEVVREWIDRQDLEACIKLQQDLLATYRDDFHKYGGEMEARLLARIMVSIAQQIGNKFVFSRVDPALKIPSVKKALTQLTRARVCSTVLHTSGNGVPLGAESNEKFFKALIVDTGLVSVQLGLSAVKPAEIQNLIFSNKGGLAEQFVGQQLRAFQSPTADPQLYYWQRTGGRLGEIDYVIQYGNRVVPVEVKSGAIGKMKSLHQFMAEKKLNFAIRCNIKRPAVETIDVKTTLGHRAQYRLLSIPLYLTERIADLMGQVDQV